MHAMGFVDRKLPELSRSEGVIRQVPSSMRSDAEVLQVSDGAGWLEHLRYSTGSAESLLDVTV